MAVGLRSGFNGEFAYGGTITLQSSQPFVIETDDLPLRFDEPNSPFPDDKVHFNTYGILELGKRFAEKYIKEG